MPTFYARDMTRISKACFFCGLSPDDHEKATYACPPMKIPLQAVTLNGKPLPPEVFIELGQGSRDREWVAMEQAMKDAVSEELTMVPGLLQFVEDVRGLHTILASMAEAPDIEPTHPAHKLSEARQIADRNFHRGERAVAKNASNRIYRALFELEKTLKALEKRKENVKR